MEKLNVKWNDFSTNTSSTVRNLFEDEAFEDVTLACEDGKQIKAHKSILSSSSPLFRLILVSNPHQHPLIYLKGIMLEELKSIKEFIYLGKTEVWQGRFKSFMAAAKDLEIKGLTDQEQNYSCDISTDPIDEHETKDEEIDNENFQISLVKTEREDDEEENMCTDMVNESYDEHEYVDACENNTIMPHPDPLEEQSQAERQDISHAGHYHNDHRRQFDYLGLQTKVFNMYGKPQGKKFSCSQCSKVYGSQIALSTHTKAEHEGIRYPCSVCPYQAKRKSHLNLHMEKRHFPAVLKPNTS